MEALTCPVAGTFLQSANPSGDAVYGYTIALRVTSVVYLLRRHGRVGTP